MFVTLDIRSVYVYVYVYGSGGHSQVVAEILGDTGRNVKAFINDDSEHHHPNR